MNGTDAAFVWCPFPDKEAARQVASQMLAQKLIACANLFGDVESVYTWQDSVQSSQECGALFKTNTNNLDELIRSIGELHPYETPAILGWRCDAAYPETINWLERSLQPD